MIRAETENLSGQHSENRNWLHFLKYPFPKKHNIPPFDSSVGLASRKRYLYFLKRNTLRDKETRRFIIYFLQLKTSKISDDLPIIAIESKGVNCFLKAPGERLGVTGSCSGNTSTLSTVGRVKGRSVDLLNPRRPSL